MRKQVLDELHQALYSAHLGYQKTMIVARKSYFWPTLKKDVANCISRCEKCQQVKAEHQHPVGLL